MVQQSIPGGDGGWRSLECPTCGETFVWKQSNDITKILTCKNTNPNTGKPCGHKMPRADWEYWRMKEGKHDQSRRLHPDTQTHRESNTSCPSE